MRGCEICLVVLGTGGDNDNAVLVGHLRPKTHHGESCLEVVLHFVAENEVEYGHLGLFIILLFWIAAEPQCTEKF